MNMIAFRHTCLWSLYGILCSSLMAYPSTASADGALKLDETTRQSIRALFQDVTDANKPGYAIGIVKNGHLVYEAGFGNSNLEDGVSITGQTAFHIASLSKQFTASAVAVLIEKGQLSLDDPVSQYIPAAARYGTELKIKHLVYMTSGLVEYSSVERKGGPPWYSAYYFDMNEAIDASLSKALEFRPGKKWAYRNINYMLLAKTVEKITGQSLNDYLDDQFFKPLGMAATLVADDPTLIIAHRAIGYAPRNDAVLKEGEKIGMRWRDSGGWVRLDRVSPHYGGSGVFSTVEDLAKWNTNFNTGKVGGPGYTALMESRMRFQYDKDNDAFGLVWRTYRGYRLLDYSGEDLDANTYMARFPDSQMSVICLSNMFTGDCESRSHQIIDILIETGFLQPVDHH